MTFSLTDTVYVPPARDQDTVVLVDADYWTYQLAAVLQSKNPKPESNTSPVQLADETIVHVEPERALYTLIDATLRDIKDIFRSENIEVYLQGVDNFRDKLAVTKPYKGGRSKVKPFYYRLCRDYLKEKHGAVVVDGMETDDMVSIRQCESIREGIPSVIVSPDKDLKNTPGFNFNPRTKSLTFITSEMAARHFWEQMVIGDNSVDNIPGVHRVGAKWVNTYHYLSLPVFRKAVINLYQKKHSLEYMVEQGNLLHMCRTDSEIGTWTPDYAYDALDEFLAAYPQTLEMGEIDE